MTAKRAKSSKKSMALVTAEAAPLGKRVAVEVGNVGAKKLKTSKVRKDHGEGSGSNVTNGAGVRFSYTQVSVPSVPDCVSEETGRRYKQDKGHDQEDDDEAEEQEQSGEDNTDEDENGDEEEGEEEEEGETNALQRRKQDGTSLCNTKRMTEIITGNEVVVKKKEGITQERSISMMTEDYYVRLVNGGNIFSKDKMTDKARRIANNFMWTNIKFIAKNDADIVVYNGELCRLMLCYTSNEDVFYKDYLLTEANRVSYWRVAQKVLRNALFRKRSAVSSAIKNKFFSK